MHVSNRVATALLVAAALFIEILDSTVIVTVIPVMAKDFGIPAVHLSVGVSAYLVAVTIVIPASGYLADKYSPRTIFISAVFIFTVASLLYGLSENLVTFTLARILQGVGGALMVPVGRFTVLKNCPKHKIVQTVAIFTWPALTAPLIGPVFGGWIVTYYNWSWIFFINIPLGLFAMLASKYLLSNQKLPVGPFDSKGFILCGLSFASLMTGLELISMHEANNNLLIMGGCALLLGAVIIYITKPLCLRGFRV